MQQLANDACGGVCLGKVQLNRIVLALDEMFANIHAHGYANQGGKIDCTAKWTKPSDEQADCKLDISLRDFAPTVENLECCKGVCPETLKDNPVAGGLGMYLIEATTEKFEHTPFADGNLWRLVFNVVVEKDIGNESEN
ncbi:MAG: ATP-binding protein [Ghiorsea sp.]